MESDVSFFWNLFYKAPIIGIVRGIDQGTVKEIAKAYVEAGLTTLEITMNTPNAPAIIAMLRREFSSLNIGAGTVCNSEQLAAALDAGTQFIVTPILSEVVISQAVSQGIPIFPGAYSPTEIHKAWSLGASAVKIFPATQLGPQFIKDVKAPLNEIKLLPTGGVSLENIKSFFHAGAIGVGMGSSLLDKELILKRDFDGLKNHFVKVKNEILEFIKI